MENTAGDPSNENSQDDPLVLCSWRRIPVVSAGFSARR